MDTTIVALEAPFRVVEQGRGGRANRIPNHTVWELTEAAGGLTAVRVSHWTEPGARRPRPRAAQRRLALSGPRLARGRCAACATTSSPTSRPPSASPSPVATGTRRASPSQYIDSAPPMSPHRRPLLSLLALLALLLLVVGVSACGYESDSKQVGRG